MIDLAYAVAVYIQMLAMLALLVKFWCTETCAGMSGTTQFLFGLAFTMKYIPDLETTTFLYGSKHLKLIYLVIIYCTLLSIFIFFIKTYQRKYDTFRIELLLFGCLLGAVLVNFHGYYWPILMTFGVYVDSIALFAQTHFVMKADCVYYIFYYVVILAAYDILHLVHLVFTSDIYLLDNGVHQVVAAGCFVQLVVCGHFLWTAWKRLRPEELEENESQDAEVGGLRHTCAKGSRDKCNICSVVMTPEIMTVTSDAKVKLLDAEETN